MSSMVFRKLTADLAQDTACGGKARGLARLLAAGARVPPAYVLDAADPADAARVAADYRDGVLTVTLPRREDTRPRQIQING